MRKKRYDSNGKLLKTGETYRKDGLYMYRWQGADKTRHHLYAKSLSELRKKEKVIEQELLWGVARSDKSLNDQIRFYLSLRKNLKSATMENYKYYFQRFIEGSSLGAMKLCDIKKSHILMFYAELKDAGLSNGSIAIMQKIIHPALELAVDDDLIHKNPSKECMKDYSIRPEVKSALTIEEEQEFIERIQMDRKKEWLYPFYLIMLITGIRLSEMLGLTWDDIDMEKRTISINHQLLYRRIDNKMVLYCQNSTKTEGGKRIIPMNDELYELFEKQREIWSYTCTNPEMTIDGYSGFIFVAPLSKEGKPIMHTTIRRNLGLIVKMNNRREVQLPPISPHILRHTAASRMSESGMDQKTVQYILGHSDPRTTMKIYDHVDIARARREQQRYDDLRNSLCLKPKTQD